MTFPPDDRHKTEECLWCGASEATGAVLRPRPRCFGGNGRHECTDAQQCNRNIRSQLIKRGVRP
jgi:hypothetical protein